MIVRTDSCTFRDRSDRASNAILQPGPRLPTEFPSPPSLHGLTCGIKGFHSIDSEEPIVNPKIGRRDYGYLNIHRGITEAERLEGAQWPRGNAGRALSSVNARGCAAMR